MLDPPAVVADAIGFVCRLHGDATPRDTPTLAIVARQVVQAQMVHGRLGMWQIKVGGGYVCTGRPRGVSGYHRAWYMSVSCARVPPSACMYKFVGNFSCAQIDLRKAREHEVASLDEKSTSSGIAEPYAR